MSFRAGHLEMFPCKKFYRTTKIKFLIDRDINDRIKFNHIGDKIDVLSYQNPKKKRKINF